MIRLFAALSIPAEVGAALVTRQTGIDGARWRPLEALHVTLRFFGEVREDVARDLDAELLSLRVRPFEITLQGAGAFGEGPDLHAVWAGVADTPELTRLAAACERAARRVGLPVETRRYRPHVTLAYLRRPDPRQAAAWMQANNLLRSPPILVSEFGLFSSVLTAEGSRYTLEASYPLARHGLAHPFAAEE
jgi:2'-5' RNA ligase